MAIDTSKLSRFDPAERIHNSSDAATFLNAALAENPALLPAALHTIARAKGINEIVEETGIPRKTLYRALNGESELKLDTLYKLTEALGVSLQFANTHNAKTKAAA